MSTAIISMRTPGSYSSPSLLLPDGIESDVNGSGRSEEGDVSARSANLQQVSDYISANSIGNAVLVYGDTNARYTSSGENIRTFETQNGMVNPWVELVLDGVEPTEGTDAVVCENPTTTQTCETVDKILYVFLDIG